MLLLEACAQSAVTPATNRAAARVLDRLGITLETVSSAGCCGAVSHHLAAQQEGLDYMRNNIDAWWPEIENGAEAVVSTASGCGVMVSAYGDLLAHDPKYADKAARVSSLAKDIAEVVRGEGLGRLDVDTGSDRVAVHTPCTMSHGLQQPELISEILGRAGFELVQVKDAHLCCGSAGTYSILQPDISRSLARKKRDALSFDRPTVIASANVGCQIQLAKESEIPVVHWIELLDR